MEPAEVISKAKSFRRDSVWMALKARWDRDFNLLRQKPYNAGVGYYSYTSNSAHILAKKSISTLSRAKLIIRTPLELQNVPEPERKMANNIERLLYGGLANNDDRLYLMGLPSLRDQMSWYSSIRGSWFLRILVHKNDKGKTVTNIAAWDAYATSYGQGSAGLTWACHIKKATKSEVESEYPDFKIENNDQRKIYDVYDYWDEKENGVVINGMWAKKMEEHGVDGCPVFRFVVGSMPDVWQENYPNAAIHRGESVFSPNRLIFPIMNKIISDLATIVRRGVKTPLVIKSQDGKKTLDKDIYQVEQAAVISLRSDQSIDQVIKPSMPADSGPLIGLLSGEIQRGGYSNLSMGQIEQRLSGFAIANIKDAEQIVIVPFIEAMLRAYRVISNEVLRQFGSSNLAPIKVRGYDSKGKLFGAPKSISITPKDIDPDWYPEIDLVPIFPTDDAQKFNLAALATEKNLLAPDTIKETILGVQDLELENSREVKDFARQIPTVRLYLAFLQAMGDEREDIAGHIKAEFVRLMGGQQQPGQGAGQQPALPGLLEQVGMALGTGVQPESQGLPSNVLPSEAQGGLPGGALNALLGGGA